MTSVMTTFTAASFPVLVTFTVYSSTSPGATLPPLRSATAFDDVLKSGLNVEIEVMNAPR
jgi:hypothetical protein